VVVPSVKVATTPWSASEVIDNKVLPYYSHRVSQLGNTMARRTSTVMPLLKKFLNFFLEIRLGSSPGISKSFSPVFAL